MAVNPFMGRGGVGVPLQLRQTGGAIAPQVTARGRQLQSSPPPIPQSSGVGAGMAGLGKALGDIAGVIKESRQQANRKALIDSLVSDTDVDQGDAFDAAPMTMLGEDEMFGDDEGNIPTTAQTPVARPSKKINKMEAEGIPPRAQNAIRRYQQSGNYDEAFKIYNTFAMKEPTTYKMGLNEVITDERGNVIAEGRVAPPKDNRTSDMKNYQAAVAGGYTGSFQEFLQQYGKKGTTVNVGGASDFGAVPKGSRRVQRKVPKTPENPEGVVYEIVPLKGSEEYEKRAKLKKKEAGSQESKERILATVNRDINQSLDFIDETSGDIIGPTGFGSLLANLPNTDAKKLSVLLDGIKSQISIQSLQSMRDNSPTGGALGNVTERELDLLASSFGRIDQSGPPELLKERLRDLQRIFHEVVHGPEEGRRMYEAQQRARARNKSAGGVTIPKDKADALVNKYLNKDN